MTNAADDVTGVDGLPPIPPLPPLPELPSFELPEPVGAASPSDLSATAPLPEPADTTPLPELSETPPLPGAAHAERQPAPVPSSVPELADPVFDGTAPPAPPYAPYPPYPSEDAAAPYSQPAPQGQAYPVQGYAPPGYAQPGGYPGAYVPPVDGRRANGMAVSGFVVGLVSVFLPLFLGLIGGIVGLILSIVGVSKHDPIAQTSKGLGVAGIVLSAIAIVFIL